MIIEIIAILLVLGSFIGFIYAITYFFHHKRRARENRLALKFIEIADDPDNPVLKSDVFYKSRTQRFFEGVEDIIGWVRIIKWTGIIIILFIVYHMISGGLIQQSQNTPAPTPAPIPTPVKTSQNYTTININQTTINDIISPLFNGQIPLWLTIIILAIPLLILWRMLRHVY